jgi:hypothetical protein
VPVLPAPERPVRALLVRAPQRVQPRPRESAPVLLPPQQRLWQWELPPPQRLLQARQRPSIIDNFHPQHWEKIHVTYRVYG